MIRGLFLVIVVYSILTGAASTMIAWEIMQERFPEQGSKYLSLPFLLALAPSICIFAGSTVFTYCMRNITYWADLRKPERKIITGASILSFAILSYAIFISASQTEQLSQRERERSLSKLANSHERLNPINERIQQLQSSKENKQSSIDKLFKDLIRNDSLISYYQRINWPKNVTLTRHQQEDIRTSITTESATLDTLNQKINELKKAKADSINTIMITASESSLKDRSLAYFIEGSHFILILLSGLLGLQLISKFKIFRIPKLHRREREKGQRQNKQIDEIIMNNSQMNHQRPKNIILPESKKEPNNLTARDQDEISQLKVLPFKKGDVEAGKAYIKFIIISGKEPYKGLQSDVRRWIGWQPNEKKATVSQWVTQARKELEASDNETKDQLAKKYKEIYTRSLQTNGQKNGSA